MNDPFTVRHCLDGRSRPSFSVGSVRLESFELVHRGYIADPTCVDAAARFASSYKTWCSELSRHVFGQFAIALYDQDTETLFATHDDFGTVPLFYAEVEGDLFVSTHLNVIVKLTGVRTLDEEFIADYIGEGWHFGPRTPYAHIKRLQPGESLVCRRGSVRILAGEPLSEEPLTLGEMKSIEEQLLQLVTDAVAGCMHSGERIWCELSGGLDSSTIFSLAARGNSSDLAALSYVYKKTSRCDESEWIRIALEMYPRPWHRLDADEMRPFSSMPMCQYAEPSMKIFMGAKEDAYHRLLTANGVDVVLSGEGGDGIFVADNPQPYHHADYFRCGDLNLYLRELRKWTKLSNLKRPSMYWFLRSVLRPTIRHARGELLDYEFAKIPWINPEYAKHARLETRGRRSSGMHRKSVAATGYMEGVMRGALAAAMSYQIPYRTSQFRHPLLYRPLVEFMQRVPWSLHVAPDGDRVLQRRAFAGVLPEKIRRRVSKVAGDPWVYTGMRDSSAWCERLTSNARIVERGYVDPRAWSEAVRDATIGKTVGIRLFLASATLEAWLQELESDR